MIMGPIDKPRDFKGTMRRLAEHLAPYRVTILIVMLLAAASTIFAIVGPKILGRATTTLFEGVLAKIAGTGTVDFIAIGRILLTALGLYLLSATLSYIQGWLMTNVAMKATYELRRDIMGKIHRMPFGYFDGTPHGEVLSHLTNDVDTISQTLNQSLTQIITSATSVIGVLVMMVTISWSMTLIALLIIPISLVVVRLIIRRSQAYFAQQQDYLGHVNGYVEEMYGGQVIVKAFNAEEKVTRRFGDLN